jgi:CubicO group peptidase (beta-lactamase class C family)
MQWDEPVRAAFSFVASFLACISACNGQDDLSRMEEVIQSYGGSNKFMGSILVARDDQILLDKGYGYANLEWQIPNSPDTKFRLGSITKQFTAACILLLEERGKLKTDDW